MPINKKNTNAGVERVLFVEDVLYDVSDMSFVEDDEDIQDCVKLLAPVDELTGVPLPIKPPLEVPPFGRPDLANWHHLYHPSNSKLLTTSSGLAIRHSRLQLLPVATHHNYYHHLFEQPSRLPRTNAQRFGQLIITMAGYIPSHAIDLHADDPTIAVPLSTRLRQRLQTSGELEARGQGNIAGFIKDYLVVQDLSHVKETVIEEFLDTHDMDRKNFLGHWLLAIASEVAVEPVKPIYKQALDEGLIMHKKKLPNLAKQTVNGRKTSHKAIKALHKKLSKKRPR